MEVPDEKEYRHFVVSTICGSRARPATHYLINEPTTLLDIGMMRLETLAMEFENRVGLHWTDDDGVRMFGASIHPSYVREDDVELE